jgi:hypothetical protein
MNNKLERVRNEVFVVLFKLLSWNMPGRTEENHEISVRLTDLRAEI